MNGHIKLNLLDRVHFGEIECHLERPKCIAHRWSLQKDRLIDILFEVMRWRLLGDHVELMESQTGMLLAVGDPTQRYISTQHRLFLVFVHYTFRKGFSASVSGTQNTLKLNAPKDSLTHIIQCNSGCAATDCVWLAGLWDDTASTTTTTWSHDAV